MTELPDTGLRDIKAAMSGEERRLTSVRRFFQLANIPCVVALGALPVLPGFTLRGVLLAMLLPCIGIAITTWFRALLLTKINALTRRSDDTLTWKARQVGKQFGTRIDRVIIDESGRGRTRAFCELDGKNVIVLSRMLLDVASKHELEFVLTSAVAASRSFVPAVTTADLLLYAFSFAIAIANIRFRATYTFILAMLTFVLSSLTLLRHRRARERELKTAITSDDLAVGLTGDPSAARSALDKIAPSWYNEHPRGRGDVSESLVDARITHLRTSRGAGTTSGAGDLTHP